MAQTAKLKGDATLMDQILAYLKGGDDKKVMRFTHRLKKYYATQIAAREALIEKYEDQLEDLHESAEDVRLNIDLAAINEASSLDSYCEQYVERLNSKHRQIESLESTIESERKAIARLESLRAFSFKQ